MEDKSLIKKYESFLKLNHLKLTSKSASDFIDLEEGPTLMELSMEYVKKGASMQTKTTKLKYYNNALEIYKDNFAAKVSIVEANGYHIEDYVEILDEEYDRLLQNDYLEPKYYQNGIVDFAKYQDTFNYLRGLRSYYISLVAAEKIEEAIKEGTLILELNPSDHFHIKSSLCFLYLKLKDTVSALELFQNNKDLIYGTKELASAYAAYLNNDEKKALDYLSDLEAVSPYLYRLVTKEIGLEGPKGIGSTYSDAIYVYLSFISIGDAILGFTPIIQKSLDDHPIIKTLTKDERDILKVLVFENVTYLNNDFIRKQAKKYHLVDYVANFSDGRMESIQVALESRGILKDGVLTIYGMVVRDYLEDSLNAEADKRKREALLCFEAENNLLGLECILSALDYAPNNLFLRKIYLFHTNPFDFHYARKLIHDMSILYQEYNKKVYLSPSKRQELLEALDELHYRYYSEAYKEKGVNGLIEAYTQVENQFTKYTNLIQMAQVIRGDKLNTEQGLDFYYLYKEYLEKGTISYERILNILSYSKLEYSDYKRKTERIPYKLLDERFYRNYLGVLEVVKIHDILTDSEEECLKAIYLGGKAYDSAKWNYTFILNTNRLEQAFFIKGRENKKGYDVYNFVEEYFKNLEKE